MPADSTVVKTTTENVTGSVSGSHGILDVVVEWWWVLILLAIIAYIGYAEKKWVINFYRKVYIKFLIKMDRTIKIYGRWDNLIIEERYDQVITECVEADKSKEIPVADKKKINDYRGKAENAKKHKEIEDLLNDIESNIKCGSLCDASSQIVKSRELINGYAGKEKKSLLDRIESLEIQIKNIKLEQYEKKVREAIDTEDYDFLVRAFSINNIAAEGLSKKDILSLIIFVKNTWKTLITKYVGDGKIEDAIILVKYSLQFDVLKDDEFVGEQKDYVVNAIKQLISNEINDYFPAAAKSIRDRYAEFLPNSVLRELNRNIEICENSKPAKIKDHLSKAVDAAKKELFMDAWNEYEKAKNLEGAELSETKQEIELLENEYQKRINIKKYNNLLEKIEREIKADNDVLALNYIKEAELMDIDDKSKLVEFSAELSKMQKANEEEKKFYEKVSIVLAKCDKIDFFNVPKKEYHGEDADPYVNVDNGRRWGILSVFDGMGGAGARKYKHEAHTEKTESKFLNAHKDEEHTSAWWASRIVKEAIEDLMYSRPKGEDPIMYLERNVKTTIVAKLNDVIKEFPAANAPLLSKMMRKLPTTMALCIYKIEESNIIINSYWSGDSRIYMFDKGKMYFLTKDDADALDGDPFSPANMDLAMNNTICQDRDFRINKSTIKVSYDSSNPIVLVAATDGCFGYFKNPIEFEYTIRHSLLTSGDIDEWLPTIRKAIIDNIQQDDFSMALVEIGDSNFVSFKENLTSCLNNVLFEEYYNWRNSSKKSQETILSNIAEIDGKINSCKDEIDGTKKTIEKIEGDIDKSAFLSEYEDAYDSFKKKLLDRTDKENQKLLQLNHKMEELLADRKSQKETLDSIQLQADAQNNEWYAKYKDMFEIVNSVEIVE